jgi:hypothetical protein
MELTRMLKRNFLINILSLIAFFTIETFFYNEILLFCIILIAVFYKFIVNKSRDVRLFIIGTGLGILIEWYMGNISRTQYWRNTLFLPIPIWLPLAWGYGFTIIHNIGTLLDLGSESNSDKLVK